MKKKLSIWPLLALGLFLPATLYAVANWYGARHRALPILHAGQRLPAFSLINQDGKTRHSGTDSGEIVVTGFFFTRCPVVCPRMANHLKLLAAAQPSVRIRLISIDPERDGVEELKAFARRFGLPDSNWDLLTGNKKIIYDLARQSYRIAAADGDGGTSDFIHSDELVLTDRQQRIRGYYPGTDVPKVQQLLSDIKKLQHEK